MRLLVALLLAGCAAPAPKMEYRVPTYKAPRPTPSPKPLTYSQVLLRLAAYCAALPPTKRGHYSLANVDTRGSDPTFECQTPDDDSYQQDSMTAHITDEVLRP